MRKRRHRKKKDESSNRGRQQGKAVVGKVVNKLKQSFPWDSEVKTCGFGTQTYSFAWPK